MTIGVIGNPGGWSSERLADAAERRCGRRHLIDPGGLTLDVGSGRLMGDGVVLDELDAIIVKKIGRGYAPEHLDRLELLRAIDGRGPRIFSRPARILRVLDRLACTVTLRANEVPMPETVVTESLEDAEAAVERFGRAVLKPLFTSKGRGMELVRAGPEAGARLAAFREAGNPVLYVQELIEHDGSDLGITFLGGDYVGTYARVAEDDSWNTAVRRPGRYQAFEPDAATIELAHRAQSPFGLAFTSVDVVLAEPEGPLVWEVSAFGGFRGLWEAHGIDAAELYVDHVLRQTADA